MFTAGILRRLVLTGLAKFRVRLRIAILSSACCGILEAAVVGIAAGAVLVILVAVKSLVSLEILLGKGSGLGAALCL